MILKNIYEVLFFLICLMLFVSMVIFAFLKERTQDSNWMKEGILRLYLQAV